MVQLASPGAGRGKCSNVGAEVQFCTQLPIPIGDLNRDLVLH